MKNDVLRLKESLYAHLSLFIMTECQTVGRPQQRRQFISLLAGAASLATLSPSIVPTAAYASAPRQLSFRHLHTGETLQATYWHSGDYDTGALSEIDQILRDFRTGETYPIAPGLLDMLHVVRTELGVEAPFHVIGGYRSPKTNAMLRKRSNGVAKRSLHMQGRAIDVRLPGINSALLRAVAADLRLGGVGYYRRSDFVHLDTGRPRVW